MKRSIISLILGTTFLFTGCAERDKNGNLRDTPTYGSIKIAIDESLRPLLEAEVDTFQGNYTYTNLHPTYTSEAEAIDLLLKDSIRMAIITRQLTSDEMEVFRVKKIIPDQIKVAYDGVALIVNRANPDSVLLFSQLQDLVKGQLTDWKQINPSNRLGPIEVVLDNPKSGFLHFINDSISKVDQLPSRFYGVKSNEAVIDYVSKKTNAIGLIGACWISDRDDPSANRFLNSIRVVRIGKNGERPVQPYQAYIADKEYPLRRMVYMISREARMGLASGFIAFVAGDKGQRIVLKSGMVPATMPTRNVKINKNQIE